MDKLSRRARTSARTRRRAFFEQLENRDLFAITSPAGSEMVVDENVTAVLDTIQATGLVAPITYGMTGVDNEHFFVNSTNGAIRFDINGPNSPNVAANFENPQDNDSGNDNVYNVTLKAIGASNAYLYRVIVQQAIASALIGYPVAMAVTAGVVTQSGRGGASILVPL